MKQIDDPIRLGVMLPLTGVVAMYGAEIAHAAQIACREINNRGGILGRPLVLILEDDGSLPQSALDAARRLSEDHHCVGMIGNLLSNSRILVAQYVADQAHVPYLSFSFYEGGISGRYFFHLAALPNQQIDKMIPFMADRYGPKMFFAGTNYEWPRGSIDAAKRVLTSLGGDVIGEHYLPIGATLAEIDALLGEVARSGADVFVPYFAGDDQVAVLTRFTDMGLKTRMGVVMGHFDEVMASRLRPEVRAGFYSCNTYFMTVDTAKNRDYLQQLADIPEVTGVWPHGNGMLTNFGEGVYLCVHAFAKAVESAGTTDAAALVTALEHIQVEGPQGEVSMDAVTHHAHVNSYLACCNAEGTFSIVSAFGQLAPSIPERYQQVVAVLTATESPAAYPQRLPCKDLPAGFDQPPGAMRQILLHADAAVLATDPEGIIINANPKVAAMFGYSEAELLGIPVHQLLPPHLRQRHAEHIRRFVYANEASLSMTARNDLNGYRKDGSFFPVEISIAKFALQDEWILVVTLNDISERKRSEQAMHWRATHDLLTCLPNRTLLAERLGHALERSRRSKQRLALLFIDLDGFKLVNDAYGHQTGDALLKAAAQRLIELVRPGDTVARFAGDEFVILCEQIDEPADIAAVVERINDAFHRALDVEGLSIYITASVGVALGEGAHDTVDELLRSADIALYAAKQKGRDTWQFFNAALQEQTNLRLSISLGLRHALDRNELSTRFQPIVAADTGAIVGVELLLRWHASDGDISPAIFIPVAEMTGAIVPIGRWVFLAGCRAAASWQRSWGVHAPYISINLSVRQLISEHLVEEFTAIMKETGANPEKIVLEVTETSMMGDVETHKSVLCQLAAMGIQIAVDDFGTGYSSLSQLTRLPVSVLKIDRAFVSSIETQPESLAVTRAVIGLGKALGLRLVAEGVETETQRQVLNDLGCDTLQGFLFYRPLLEAQLVAAMVAQCANGSDNDVDAGVLCCD